MLKLERHPAIVEGHSRKGKPSRPKSAALYLGNGPEMDKSVIADSLGRQRFFMLTLGVGMAAICLVMQAQQPASPSEQTGGQPRRFVIAKSIPPGGTVTFDVNDADVRIVRNLDETQVRLEVKVETGHLDLEQAQQLWLKQFDAEGDRVSIQLQLPTDRSAGSVTLYVPTLTPLVVKQHAGRLTVNGVKGDKNLNVGSGMLTLREADPSSYLHVKAEVGVGQITNEVFHGKESGLLGRKLVVEGSGPYRLLLHVGNGDIVLTPEDGGS